MKNCPAISVILNKKIYLSPIITILLLTVASCSNGVTKREPNAEKASGPAAAVQTTSYRGVGIVKSLAPKVPSIEVDHEEIKGLMPAMQMDFHVKDKSLLNGLVVEDKIEFTVESGIGGLKITAIKKI